MAVAESGGDGRIFVAESNAGDIGDRLAVVDTQDITNDGASVAYRGTVIGNIDPLANGEDGAALHIHLTGAADDGALQALCGAIRFEALGDEPDGASLETSFAVQPAGGGELIALAGFDSVPVLPFDLWAHDGEVDSVLSLGLPDHGDAQIAGTTLFLADDYQQAVDHGAMHALDGFTPGAGGDTLDLHDLLSSGNYQGGSLEGYVHLDDSSGTHTVLAVDLQGAGNYVPIALIDGVVGLGSPDHLLDSGNIVV
jgi:hypothetical protein